MRSFVSVAEEWVLRDCSYYPSPAQRDRIHAFSWWLSNRFSSPDTIPDVGRAWDEFLRDPSERMYSVWHTPPNSAMPRTDPLPTRTLAAARHQAEKYLAAGEGAGVNAVPSAAVASPAIVYSADPQQTAQPFLSTDRSRLDSSADTAIHHTAKVDPRRSMLAAAGIVVAGVTTGIINFQVTTLVAHWIEMQQH